MLGDGVAEMSIEMSLSVTVCRKLEVGVDVILDLDRRYVSRLFPYRTVRY